MVQLKESGLSQMVSQSGPNSQPMLATWDAHVGNMGCEFGPDWETM